jgi:hypothetical protein
MFQRFPVLSCRNQPVIFDLGMYRYGLSYYTRQRRIAERRRAFIEARNMYYQTHPAFNNDDHNHGNDDNASFEQQTL